MSFIRKHAVITGGANGIGRYIAETFLREGIFVTVIDIDGKGAQYATENLCFYHGDIADKRRLAYL